MALACLRDRMDRLKYNRTAKEFIKRNIQYKSYSRQFTFNKHFHATSKRE